MIHTYPWYWNLWNIWIKTEYTAQTLPLSSLTFLMSPWHFQWRILSPIGTHGHTTSPPYTVTYYDDYTQTQATQQARHNNKTQATTWRQWNICTKNCHHCTYMITATVFYYTLREYQRLHQRDSFIHSTTLYYTKEAWYSHDKYLYCRWNNHNAQEDP
jgi:hypothetical protein